MGRDPRRGRPAGPARRRPPARRGASTTTPCSSTRARTNPRRTAGCATSRAARPRPSPCGCWAPRRSGPSTASASIRGDVARGVAAYCGADVYLDVALSWVVPGARHCPVTLRDGAGPSFRLQPRGGCSRTSGSSCSPRARARCGSRASSASLAILLGLVISAWVLWGRLAHQVPVAGWTSMIVVVCFFSGLDPALRSASSRSTWAWRCRWRWASRPTSSSPALRRAARA